MKSIFLYLWILLIPCYNYAQDAVTETNNLQSLCKIWGFLKYYHPNVAEGKFDWDAALLQVLPTVKEIDNNVDLSNFYIKWIHSLGTIKKRRVKPSKDSFDKNFDLTWMGEASFLTDSLKNNLKYIERNRHQGKSQYVKLGKYGEIKILNEKKYKTVDYPEEDYRLLNLFRYWNVINYFYPHKYLMDTHWNVTLKEMMPLFRNAATRLEYHLAMNQLVSRLDDGHVYFSTPQIKDYFGPKYLPFLLTYDKNSNAVVTKILNDSLATLNHIERGDLLLKFKGSKIATIFENTKKYIKASSVNAKYRKLSNTSLRSTDSVIIELQRKGKKIENKIALYDPKYYKYGDGSKVKWKILKNNIGYVNTANVRIKEVSLMMKNLEKTTGLIIDIRYYPSYLIKVLLNYLSEDRSPFSVHISPDISYPGKFNLTKNYSGKKNKNYYKGAVVILVNENTISRGEYLAMALQSLKNVYTIGRQTAGSDGELSRVEFVGGYRTTFTGVGVLYPDGNESQRKGVKIDKVVKFHLDDFIKGEDSILNEAILYLTNKSK
ncbi:MAG: hypothetical protein JKY08_10665 [Flavobacteriaceae bacterium]|nr:hypothetical protein [Flavobacteriaceae bacterium]